MVVLRPNMTPPSISDIRTTRELIAPHIVETPVWQWGHPALHDAIGPVTEVFLKLELFQHTGTFKPRGALSNILNLDADVTRGRTCEIQRQLFARKR